MAIQLKPDTGGKHAEAPAFREPTPWPPSMFGAKPIRVAYGLTEAGEIQLAHHDAAEGYNATFMWRPPIAHYLPPLPGESDE